MALLKVLADWSDVFEDRLGLSRRMLKTVGVKVSDNAPKNAVEDLREMLITCATCTHAAECAAWLVTARRPAEPPEFCPAGYLVSRLRLAQPT